LALENGQSMADELFRNNLRNRILACLSHADLALLQPYLQLVSLGPRQRLEGPNRKIRNAYFIERGIASVVALSKGDRRQASVALVGQDGMTGLAAVLGADRSPNETFMQVEGEGQCIAAQDLRRMMAESGSLVSSLMRYAHAYAIQVAQTALANTQGKVEERLARWLLMAHDRIEGDSLALTHELLAATLGVRRSGVTAALHRLAAHTLISTARGSVTVLDRSGLEATANGLYGVPEAESARLFPSV
jgi:CRP-like cAMP-binding protein